MSYFPQVAKDKLDEVIASGDNSALFELLIEPLHIELYQRQDFNFLDELTEGQQALLVYDYLLNQVGQGGFIQFFVNGYGSLLLEMPTWMEKIGASGMAQILDDAMKVYVLNVNLFPAEISNEDFVRLYEELKEFEILDQRFSELNDETVAAMMRYATEHLNEFILVGE